MPELTPDEIFRKDQALAKKIADEILGEAPAIEDVSAPAVSPESDIKNDTQSFAMPEDSAQGKSEDSQKKSVFKRYANVEEAVKDARQRLPRIKVVGEGEDIAFKELSGSSDAKPAPFVKRGVENEVEDIGVPSASAKVPFGEVTLGESDELVTDVEHDEKGRRIQHGEEEGDVKPHPYQTRTDAAYKAGLKVAQKEINATERAAGGLSPEEDVDTTSPTAPPKSPDVSSTPEVPASETKPADWILERVLNEIPDGGKFVLRSPTGKTHSEYHRKGNVILSSKDGVVTENVLAKLNKGWTLEIKTAGAPKATKPENHDLLKGRDPKDYNTVFPGDVWVLRTPKGEILDKLTVNYTLQQGPEIGEIIQASSTWEKEQEVKELIEGIPDLPPGGLEWRKKVFEEKLEGEGYVLEVAGEKPKAQPRKSEMIDHRKETDPYSRINSGDVWELRSPTGEKLERVDVETVFEKKKRGKKEMFVEVEIEYSQKAQIATGKKREQWQNFPLETFRNTLKEKGYVLISRGSGAELEYGGYFDEKENKKEVDPLGLPKNEDEWVRYEAAEGEIGVSYDSVKKLYTITHVADGRIIGNYSEGNIRRLAELEEWKKVGAEQAEPKLQPEELPKKAEQTPKESLVDLPEGGNELYYRADNGSEFKVRKSPVQEGTYILVALSTLQEREINEAELQDLARKNTWEQFEKGPEPLVGPEPFNDQLIEKARAVVEEARGDFVRVEAEQSGAMDRLKKYFSFLRKQDEINPEVHQCWERYENALVALQSLEIEKIKRSGLKDKELKQSIAGMIREYDFEEAERIEDAKRQLRLGKEKEPFKKRIEQHFREYVKYFNGDLSSQNRWERAIRGVPAFYMALGHTSAESVMSGVRTVGEGYNKLMRTKGGKYTMMAAGGAAFGTALIFSGGAAATMAGVLLAAKRAAAGAGFAIAAEGLGDKGAQAFRSRTTNKKAEGFFEKSKDDEIEMMLEHGLKAVNPDSERDLLLERLEKFLKKDVNQEAYGKSIKRERNRLYRKTGAVMAGVLFGNSSFVGNIFSEAQAAVPEGGGNQMAKVVEVIEKSTETMPSAGGSVPDAASLLQERTVSAGDTITKYAVTSGKSLGLEGEEGKRFAALLREKLNEKLASVDPDTAKAAGFVPNKYGVLSADFIRAEEKIELGKILSAEEMKALVEQAKETVTAPVTPPVEIPAPTSQTVLDATAKVLQEAGIAPASTPAVTEVVTPTTPDAIAEFGASKQKVTEYIQGLPQAEQVEVFRTMRGTMRDLFNTPEISIYGNYDMNYDLKEHPELAKASMSRVLEDHKTLSSRAFYMYDRSLNPLHWTQMQELDKFAAGAAKVLGKEVATPLKRESIEEYILRMALIAKESNKSFPGLHMVK